MKIFYLSALTLLISVYSKAQHQGYLGFSQTFSTFRYSTSLNEKDEFLDSDVKSGSTVGYNLDLPSVFDLRFDLSFLNLGARAAYDTESVKWDLNYLNLNANFGYRTKNTSLQPYILAGPYFSYLYKGSQEIGPTYYNLISSKALKKMDMGATALYGINFKFSKDFMLFAEARHTFGLFNIEKKETGQSLHNRAFSILLGIKLNIN
jgi:hypothetical protein